MKFNLLIFFLFIFIHILPAQEPAQTTSPVQEEVIGPKPIPVTEITTKADEIYDILTKITSESELCQR